MRDHAYLAKGYSVASKFACARKVRSTYIVFPQRQMSAELVARLVFLSCLLGCIATDSAQEEVEETHTHSISISKYESEVEIAIICNFEGVRASYYHLSFYEESIPSYPIGRTQFKSNGRRKEAWLILPRTNSTIFGVYTCCADPNIEEDSELICSDQVQVLPEGSSESIITRYFVPHGQKAALGECKNGRHMALYLQNLTIDEIDNPSDPNLNTNSTTSNSTELNIMLTRLDQQAKYLCFHDNGSLLRIEYILADHKPIKYIWPRKNGTRLPPQPAGNSLTLDCEATGRPSPSVYWYDDWYEYREDAYEWRIRTKLRQGMRLYIRHLQNHAFENYWIWCIAENVWERHVRWVKYPDEEEVPPQAEKPINVSNFKFTVKPRVVEVGEVITIYSKLGPEFSPLEYFPLWTSPSNSDFHIKYTPGGYYEGTKNATLEDDGLWNCTVLRKTKSVTKSVYYSSITLNVAEIILDLVHVEEEIVIYVTRGLSVHHSTIVFHSPHYNVEPEKFQMKIGMKGSTEFLLKISHTLEYNEENRTLTCNVSLEYYDTQNSSVVLARGSNLTGQLLFDVSYWSGHLERSIPITVLLEPRPTIPETTPPELSGLFAIPSVLAVVLVLWFVWILYCVCRHRLDEKKRRHYYNSLDPIQRMLHDLVEKVEKTTLFYAKESLVFENGILGEGAFGVVKKAILTTSDSSRVVAVKSLKGMVDEVDLKEFLKEFWTLHNVGHHVNIINLIGATVDVSECEMSIIVEFAGGGSLLKHLRRKRETGTRLSWREGLSYALQIANGMMYLANKQCIHCDLAARNILLTDDGVLKVSDFGLARTHYEFYHKKITAKTRLPLKWMAVESLESQVFTTQGDVWSFGVLLWEIATLGGSPYPGLPISDLLRSLKNGYRMPKPNKCPTNIYTIMRSCWLPEPHLRPTFNQLVAMLDLLLEDYNTLASPESLGVENDVLNYDIASVCTGSTINGDMMEDDLRSGDILSNSYVNRQNRTWHSTSDIFVDYLSEPICCRGNGISTSSSFYDDTCGYCGGKTSLKAPKYQNVDTIENGDEECVLPQQRTHSVLAHRDSHVCTNCNGLQNCGGSLYNSTGSFIHED